MDTTHVPFGLSDKEEVQGYWTEVHCKDRCAHLSARTVNCCPIGQVRHPCPVNLQILPLRLISAASPRPARVYGITADTSPEKALSTLFPSTAVTT
jgi:hypothetical protein